MAIVVPQTHIYTHYNLSVTVTKHDSNARKLLINGTQQLQLWNGNTMLKWLDYRLVMCESLLASRRVLLLKIMSCFYQSFYHSYTIFVSCE